MNLVYIGNTLINDVMLGSQRMDDVVQYITPNYVTQTATLILDAGNPTSYPGTGTNWFSLAGNVTASIQNGLETTYSTQNGGYFDFPYTSSYLINMGDLDSFGADFTINMWFTIDGLQSGSNEEWWGFVAKDSFTDNPGLGFMIYKPAPDTGLPRFWGNGAEATFTQQTIVTGSWTNIQLVRSGTTMTAYWNGSSIGSDTMSGNLNNNDGLTFGRGSSAGIYRFNGKISFLSIYTSSLSQAQVAQNYNALLPRYV